MNFFIYRGSYTYGGGGCGCCCNKKGDLLPMLAALAAAVFFIQQIIMMGGRRKRKRRKRHLYWDEDLPRSIYDDGKFPKGITFLVTNTKFTVIKGFLIICILNIHRCRSNQGCHRYVQTRGCHCKDLS